MNPTLNKKDFDDLSTNLRDLAYSYIEKYSPSKQQLKVYLMKKYLTKFRSEKTKKEVSSLIDIILVLILSSHSDIEFSFKSVNNFKNLITSRSSTFRQNCQYS